MSLLRFAAAAGVLALTAAACTAAVQRTAFTDPAKAGADFTVQGEYVGTAGNSRIGAQVIALGDGRFRAVFLPGGLPGDGWTGDGKHQVDGRREGEEAHFGTPEQGWRGCVIGDTFAGETPDDQGFELHKVERRSPTLGAAPPAGARVLFDGTDASGWTNGRMSDDGLLQVGTRSRESFGDFTLHLEFRTPFQPGARGQGRGNSGVYLQDRYEVQVLDSFGLEGKHNECGGIYQKADPAVNMCLPPLSWQTYDIDFTAASFDGAGNKSSNARVTIRHNGVVIHDDVEINGPTGGGRPETPSPGPLQLQDHGDPVHYRNIWVVAR
jgi:hypothetical protein